MGSVEEKSSVDEMLGQLDEVKENARWREERAEIHERARRELENERWFEARREEQKKLEKRMEISRRLKEETGKSLVEWEVEFFMSGLAEQLLEEGQ